MVPVQPVMDEAAVGVDFVEDGIGIAALAGREGHDFEVPPHPFQETDGEGTDRHEALLVGRVERQGDLHVISTHPLLRAVEESLI